MTFAGLVLVMVACGEPEPVVRGVPRATTVAEVAERRAAEELRATPANVDVTYTKPDGVWVDVRYFGGRTWEGARAEAERQLGAVLEEEERPDGDREVRLERGTVRLRDGRIVMVEVTLPEPLRRSESLAALGFPPTADRYLALALEYRLTNAWGFRRIRLIRAERDSEDIVRVQAWKAAPSDR